jgi:hypothetical protein
LLLFTTLHDDIWNFWKKLNEQIAFSILSVLHKARQLDGLFCSPVSPSKQSTIDCRIDYGIWSLPNDMLLSHTRTFWEPQCDSVALLAVLARNDRILALSMSKNQMVYAYQGACVGAYRRNWAILVACLYARLERGRSDCCRVPFASGNLFLSVWTAFQAFQTKIPK